jgi:hypothetical protein
MFNLKRSMLVLMLLCLISGLFPGMANAQSWEAFGGYQFEHLQPAFNGSGWEGTLTKNLKHAIGFAADFSGSYTRGRHAITYTGGPVLALRAPVVQPFVHALFGGISTDQGNINGDTNSGFAMFLGGGLDVGWRKGIGIRIVQVDWLHANIADGGRDRNMRASAGLVVKF